MLRLLPLLLWSSLVFAAPAARANVVVVMQSVFGPIEIELFDGVAPLTVANFLGYVDGSAYDQSLIHRSLTGFVIQGGGYRLSGNQLLAVASNPPTVMNEPGLSNVRGTVAMAKVGGQPNSATTQWFINLDDNSGLDITNGGFTVFADVVSGLENADEINALTIVDVGSPLDELPVMNWTPGNPVTAGNLVVLSDVARQTQPQCGDLNADARLDAADVARLRAHLVRPLALPLTPGEAGRCSVIGGATDCNLADATVLRRRLAGRTPIRAQVCPAAS
jgi:cyclophilin family peptidyl-prolyl cis-trans isomerase